MSTKIQTSPEKIHILAVDDEEGIRSLIQKKIVDQGYRCSVAASAEEALDILNVEPIDVVITDLRMPGIGGVNLLEIIKKKYDTNVIVMTGFIEDFSYENIIKKGASDLVHKPTPFEEIILRLKRVLHERAIISEMNRAHKELKDAYIDTINRLSLAAEYKDDDTGDHIVRIGNYCKLIAREYGLSDNEVQNIQYASPMHDIGKIGIPDSILLKKGRLTEEEAKTMREHTTIGFNILNNPKSEILYCAGKIALSHHEKWNGEGYPKGIIGKNIYLPGRIVCITDVFDALTSSRPYKKPYPDEIAIEIIKKGRATHFDPDITDIFLNKIDEIIKIREDISPSKSPSVSEFVWSERDLQDGTDQIIQIKK